MIKNVNESDSKYRLDKLYPGSDVATELYIKTLLEYEDRSRFWMPSLKIGAKCMRCRRRDIFTPGQRQAYSDEGKVPVEPQEMKLVINVLVDQIQKGVRSTITTFDDDTPPPTSAKPEVVNSVMGHFKQQLKLDRLKRSVLNDALITGYPTWLWFDKEYDLAEMKKYVVAYQPKWDSMLLPRWFASNDGGDINDVMKISFVTKQQLREWYPERYEVYKKYDMSKCWGKDNVSYSLQEAPESNVYSRASYVMDSIQGGIFDSHHGLIMLIEQFFPVRIEREIAISENSKPVEIPQDWDFERKEKWKANHPDFEIIINEIKTLWLKTISSDGFVWENNEHWYQNNCQLPGQVYIPELIDRIPSAVGNDMLPSILSIAASATEGLHQVRTGTGTTIHVTEGTLKHPDMVKKELNKADGVVIHKQDGVRQVGGLKNAIYTEQRKPNTTFIEFTQQEREQLHRAIGANDALLGLTNPRQSDKAKLTDINQGLATQSSYIMNYNDFCLDLENTLLSLIPHQYTTETIIQINDDYGMAESGQMMVNQGGFDYSGQAMIIANDLTNTRYKAIPMLSDDSPSNKEREKKEFIEFITAVGNALDPMVLAYILNGMENRYAKQAAVSIEQAAQQMQQAQQQAQQAEAQKELQIEQGRRAVDWAKMGKPSKSINIKLDPESAKQDPVVTQALLNAANQ